VQDDTTSVEIFVYLVVHEYSQLPGLYCLLYYQPQTVHVPNIFCRLNTTLQLALHTGYAPKIRGVHIASLATGRQIVIVCRFRRIRFPNVGVTLQPSQEQSLVRYIHTPQEGLQVAKACLVGYV
jgi:hypothetical protein